MPPTSTKPSVLEEEQEFESVLAYLERTPRLVHLLRYLGEKYFSGETWQLTEYNIATEVFGRKKTDFVASEDAIARAEISRLRKKLKSFYEAEGGDHSLELFIPAGSYIPGFRQRSPATTAALDPKAAEPPARPPDRGLSAGPNARTDTQPHEDRPNWAVASVSPAGPGHLGRLLRLNALGAACVLLLGPAMYLILQGWSGGRLQAASRKQSGPALAQQDGALPVGSAQAVSVPVPFRMIAGYTGPPQRDSSGDVWQADRYYHEGWSVRQPAVFISRTSDPFLFRYGRAGDFSYDIPLQRGTYELHLYFLQPSDTDQSEDAANKDIFTVAINGQAALDNFDIVSDAMGRNTADERVIRDVSPADDGLLHLHLSTVVGTPSLSAIQVLKGIPHAQLPIRVITQATSFTDPNGQLWHPDNYFQGGRHMSHTLAANEPANPALITTERYGHFTYAFPVDPRDRYEVVLHFVELFFGTDGTGNGNRVFRLMCNGSTLLDDFDIYKEAGSLHMLVKTFRHLKPSAQGKLNLTFEPVVNYATVSAIEVLDEATLTN